MKCIKCGQEMVNISGGNYQCPACGQAINDLVYRGEPQRAMMKAATVEATCCICGAKKEYIYNESIPFVYICDDCKKAVAWAKENMKLENDEIKIDNFVMTDEGYREVGENEIIFEKRNYMELCTAECEAADVANFKKAEQEAVRDFAKIIMSIIFEDEKDEMMKIKDFRDTIRDVLRMHYDIELEGNNE